GVSFVDTTDTSDVLALHFDIFDGITAMGVPLVPKRLLEAESSVKDGVRNLSSRARVLVTTLHHLAWSGGWKKEKYFQELGDVAGNEEDRAWLLEHIESVLGRSFAERVIDRGSRGEMAPSFSRRMTVMRAALEARSGAELGGAASLMLRYGLGHIPSLLRPAGWVGRPGDRVPSLPTVRHDLAVACGVSQHGYFVPSMRSSKQKLRTLNGERYLANHRHRWSRLVLFRWICPTAFLWLEAKRSRVVVVGRLPLVLRLLRAGALRPRWVAIPP
ncbi:MAG: hypothetical protein ACRDX9_03195, partial [Acidimicrobiia bacterium]